MKTQEIVKRYQDAIKAEWEQRKRKLFFMDDQAFLQLHPEDRHPEQQKPETLEPDATRIYLSSEAFQPRRMGQAIKDGVWRSVPRHDLVRHWLRKLEQKSQDPGSNARTPLRAVIIHASGMGKSVNLEWLAAELNANGILAIRLDKVPLNAKELRSAACTAMASHVEGALEGVLDVTAKEGRLVVLIDGLDQITSMPEPASFLLTLPAEIKKRWGFVLAGRPSAFYHWTDGGDSGSIDARAWEFVAPDRFTEEQGERYAGYQRYHLAKRQLGELAREPRVLKYIRPLDVSVVAQLRTYADVVTRVVDEALPRSLSMKDADRKRLHYLLAVLAFVSWNRRSSEVENIVYLNLNHASPRILERMRVAGFGEYGKEQLCNDLALLTKMDAIMSRASGVETSVSRIEWSSVTVIHFLAARWLSCHAPDFDDSRARTGAANGAPDAESLRIFYPESADSDKTREINQFIAEFPFDALWCKSWLRCAQIWYDPRSEDPQRKWSSEMLYRSWRTMHRLAGRPVHNWWDVSYERLKPDSESIIENDRRDDDIAVEPESAELANEILERFFSDFQRIIDTSAHARRTALEMICDESWRDVPPGKLDMGAPLDRQGFPPRLQAFWQRELDKVQTGEVLEGFEEDKGILRPLYRKAVDREDVAKLAAQRLTKSEWFTGTQGRDLRDHDIRWMTDVFKKVRRRETVDRSAEDYQDAKRDIETKWRKWDEVPLDELRPEGERPADARQDVRGLAIHRYPVLHDWYYLFSPGHKKEVEKYLKDAVKAPHPEPGRPAIYISWFDAWAFCQWATWWDPSGSGRVYKARLPHEPEWEYAVRWHEVNGQLTQTSRDKLYWWGNDFYANENDLDDLRCKEECAQRAYVNGKPGTAGPPAKLQPNGLGLCDTLGNVWEWMANVYDVRSEDEIDADEAESRKLGNAPTRVGYSRYLPAPGTQVLVNALRTMRGGLWYYLDLLATCSSRYRLTSDDRDYKMGFRIVREECQTVRPRRFGSKAAGSSGESLAKNEELAMRAKSTADRETGSTFLATCIFIALRGIASRGKTAEIAGSLAALHRTLREIDGYVLSTLFGAIVIIPDAGRPDLDGILQLLHNIPTGSLDPRVGVTHGAVQVATDVDRRHNILGPIINVAARLAMSDKNRGCLVEESYVKMFEHLYDESHWLCQPTRLSEKISGKRHDKERLAYHAPVALNASSDVALDGLVQKSAVLISYDLSGFSQGDRSQLVKRFEEVAGLFRKLPAVKSAEMLLAPGGDGGIVVLTGCEDVGAAAKGMAEELHKGGLLASLHLKDAVNVRLRVGVHYGMVMTYLTADGISRPAGHELYVADAIVADDIARECTGVIVTGLIADVASGDNRENMAAMYDQLAPTNKDSLKPILEDIERFVRK